MDKAEKLECSGCGRPLEVMADGFAKCEYCDSTYNFNLKKIQEIRGTVFIEGSVKTERADFEIRAGVLRHYHGQETDIVIPENVKEIAENCFSEMEYLSSVSFPQGLNKIGNNAFCGCSGLTQITLPQGLKTIGDCAFQRCCGLKELTLPQGLKTIGDGAFSGCNGLTKITLPQGLKTLGRVFDAYGQFDSSGSYNKNHHYGVFSGCSSLKEITLPQGLESIGDAVFSGCSSLKEITLPQGLKTIGDAVFSGCSGLTEISIPPTVTYCHGALGSSLIEKITFQGDNYIHFVQMFSDRRYSLDLGWRVEGYQRSCLKSIYPPEAEAFIAKALLKRCFMDPSPWLRQQRKLHNRCQHCGGKFTGFIFKECKNCHKKKDYDRYDRFY